MNKVFLAALMCFSFLTSINAQVEDSSDLLEDKTQVLLIDETNISSDTTNGIVKYFAVLRINGKLFQIYSFNTNSSGNYNLTEFVNFRIPKEYFTPDQIVELLTDYEFRLDYEKTHLIKSIRKTNSKYSKSTPLPSYISYTIQKLYFK